MTILHKCSKTHGRYLVLLVTSWLRLKAEKYDQASREGLWCPPRLGLTGGWAVLASAATRPRALANPRCGWHSYRTGLLFTLKGGAGRSPLKSRAGPVHGDCLCSLPGGGEGGRCRAGSWPRSGVGVGMGAAPVCCMRAGQTACCLGPAPALSTKAYQGLSSACHRCPWPQTVLGTVNGQQQGAGLRLGA